MARPAKPTSEDIGAAMMAWYADAIKDYPEGLITQAQAATMLGISRVAVGRLVARGYLDAVYFPKPPDIEGMAVGQNDPTWLKICGWLEGSDASSLPKAAFVSFADVADLWQSGEARTRCKKDWSEILADLFSGANLQRGADRRARRWNHQANAYEFRQSRKKKKEKE